MVSFNYSFDKRKPQAGADNKSSFFVFDPVKSFKYQRQLIRSNSKTGISHADACPAVTPGC